MENSAVSNFDPPFDTCRVPQHVSPQVVKFFTADDNGVCCSKTRLSQHRSHFIETGDLLGANQEQAGYSGYRLAKLSSYAGDLQIHSTTLL